ncbi:hypothetical protein [Neorhizobium galegae]|uniref:hypothetical protein n=1 Tax=Neorhizobium galegae TaxID=399 RepID=UPI00210320CA|nr:hypothetical protein [Neorhizobium galegae]MCQ1852812.1 hypothetical protein [Neorhizobium galegae]
MRLGEYPPAALPVQDDARHNPALTGEPARRVRETIDGLFDRFPEFSARIVLSGSQGFYAGLGLAALAL